MTGKERTLNEQKPFTANEAADAGQRGPQREWVTPAFEQVALKDALGQIYLPLPTMDGPNTSS